DLIDNLEDFMPQVLKGERPGMVFNLSYGIQGQARYTHVPGILEMIGIPYIGSGPLAHSLALDKVVAKMIFQQKGIPTPDFAVLDDPGFIMPDLTFPLIVKPKNEAVSFGIHIVNNEEELREAAGVIFDKFQQPVLAEQYIAGREINVGILGNNPPEAFIPAELIFGEGGPDIYTYEDKTRLSGRDVGVVCPARIDDKLTAHAQDIAIKAFNALGCFDCARVDMRLDNDGNLYILEINSLPSMGEHGSYVAAADAMGMDFPALVNRLVEVASARYFGTPSPPDLAAKSKEPATQVFNYISKHRDQLEKRLEKWCSHSSRTADLVGRIHVLDNIKKLFGELLLKPVKELTNDKVVWTWETRAGMKNGILLLCQLDIPFGLREQFQGYRRDPEWIYSEGIASVWGPLTMLEFALKSLRSIRKLRKIPLGVLFYADEGLDCRYSSDLIKQAEDQASEIIVLRPGNPGGKAITDRRGQRKYMLAAEGTPHRLGKSTAHQEVLRWVNTKMEEIAQLANRRERIAVSAVNIETDAYPMLLPHRVKVTIYSSFAKIKSGDELENRLEKILDKGSIKWSLNCISNRPPMKVKKNNNPQLDTLEKIAKQWDIPFSIESSLWPSVGGLVKQGTPVICGMGPSAKDLYTSRECIERVSLIQRTLLLSQYLISKLKE
ncbi:MAG: ATP-grasp domain-containing protein, partial [Deltaproteobacteria bacterium]|nr:ATP-grasp domain-containing protein [Deltaproteobacteria bacterium]